MNFKKIWLFFFLSFLFLTFVSGWAEEDPETEVPAGEAFEGPPPQEIGYSFVQNLPEARVVRYRNQKKSEAQWLGNRFRFPEAAGTADVFVAENFVVNGSLHEAIAVSLQPGFDTSLLFTHVPAGKRLKLFVAFPDFGLKKEKVVPAEVEVWIGQKKILETQVSTKGWKQEQVDLFLPFLLQRSYGFTIRLRSSDTEPKTVLLYGYLE